MQTPDAKRTPRTPHTPRGSLFALLLVGAALAAGLATATGPANPPPGHHTICHATGSATNPYVVISPSVAGVFNGHLGADHQAGEDIIPPFTFNGEVYSQNWDAEGQAIVEADCQLPPGASPPTGLPPGQEHHTICHATGSATNPYVLISPSIEGVYNGHLGVDHQDGRDIIPPFTYNGTVYSQNWDAEHQAILNLGCELPPATTTPPVTTTPPATTSPPVTPPQPSICVPELVALAVGDTVELTWTSHSGAEGYALYRVDGAGEAPFKMADLPADATSYTDDSTEANHVYQYHLMVVIGGAEVPCGMVEVTSIPDFPTVVGGTLATVAGAGAYLLARRRK